MSGTNKKMELLGSAQSQCSYGSGHSYYDRYADQCPLQSGGRIFRGRAGRDPDGSDLYRISAGPGRCRSGTDVRKRRSILPVQTIRPWR